MTYIIVNPQHVCYAGSFYAKHAKVALYLDSVTHCHCCGYSPRNRYFGLLGSICCEVRFLQPNPQTTLDRWTDVGSED